MSYVSDYLNTRNPYWASMYDPSRYNNMYNSTPTKEKPPVTSSTLNDMTVAELEALAERTANTLREKKAASTVEFVANGLLYSFDRERNRLTYMDGRGSALQPMLDEFLRAHRNTAANYKLAIAVLTAITPKN